MTLSSQAAQDLLLADPGNYTTPEALRALAQQVELYSPGEVTVLYSKLDTLFVNGGDTVTGDMIRLGC